jgi:hypothetical protein
VYILSSIGHDRNVGIEKVPPFQITRISRIILFTDDFINNFVDDIIDDSDYLKWLWIAISVGKYKGGGCVEYPCPFLLL